MLHQAKRSYTFSNFTRLVLLIFLGPVAIAQAQTQAIYSPVLLGRDFSSGRQFQVREDGSGFQVLPNCPVYGCGDLSHDGLVGKRYFITAQLPPSGSQPADLVVYSESGDSRTVLVSNKSYYPESAYVAWSVDGYRIAYQGKLCYAIDENGNCQFRQGLIIGEVVRDSSGVPIGVDNERLVVEVAKTYESQCIGTNPCVWEYLHSFSWSPDNQRLAYVISRTNRTSNGSFTDYFIYLLNSAPYPALPVSTKLVFSDGDQSNRTALSFSPVTRLDQQGNPLFRLAFSRLTDAVGAVRLDIWVTNVPSAYDGSYSLTPKRITTSSNAKNTYELSHINWSPDEQWLAYDGYTSALSLPRNLYKIRSDGSGKTITLTNSKKADLSLSSWRK